MGTGYNSPSTKRRLPYFSDGSWWNRADSPQNGITRPSVHTRMAGRGNWIEISSTTHHTNETCVPSHSV